LKGTSGQLGCEPAGRRPSGRGALVESEDELFRMFTRAVQRNLHVVFTMNPAGGDWKQRCTASPALFNRCVVDWFGTWSDSSLIPGSCFYALFKNLILHECRWQRTSRSMLTWERARATLTEPPTGAEKWLAVAARRSLNQS
jgi:hypothetical protein